MEPFYGLASARKGKGKCTLLADRGEEIFESPDRPAGKWKRFEGCDGLQGVHHPFSVEVWQAPDYISSRNALGKGWHCRTVNFFLDPIERCVCLTPHFVALSFSSPH